MSVATLAKDGTCSKPSLPAPLVVSVLLGRQHQGYGKGCPQAPTCGCNRAPKQPPAPQCPACKVRLAGITACTHLAPASFLECLSTKPPC